MKVSVAKYWIIFLTQLKNLFEYRVTILLKLLRPLIITFAISALWWIIFNITGKEEIAGFSLFSFIFYLLVVRFIASINPGHTTIREINEEVRSGRIAIRVVRPMNYLLWLTARALPVPLFSGVLGIIIVTIFGLFFDVALPTPLMSLFFIISLAASIILYYAFYLLIGILSFWFYMVYPFERFFQHLRFLLSGEFIPLTLFGSFLGIVQYNPLAGLAFIPAGMYIGLFDVITAIKLILSQFIWCIVLWLLLIWLYRKGLKTFESQGG